MPRDYKIHKASELLFIDSYGLISKDDMLTSINTINRHYKNKKISKVIIDARKQESMPSLKDIVSLTGKLPKKIKLAVICPSSQETHRSVWITSKWNKKNGSDVKMFDTCSEAFDWLEKGTHSLTF